MRSGSHCLNSATSRSNKPPPGLPPAGAPGSVRAIGEIAALARREEGHRICWLNWPLLERAPVIAVAERRSVGSRVPHGLLHDRILIQLF